MTGSIASALAAVRRAVDALEPGRLTGDDAVGLLRQLTETERILAAARVAVARRVDESNAWRASGERSAAHFLAREIGTGVGAAGAALETARRLDDLPATKEAFRTGRLSEAQAREIASAAETAEQESRLLETAETRTLSGLRAEAQSMRAANQPSTMEAMRARRSCRTWTDTDGMFRLDARLAPDDGARVRAAIDAHRQHVFAEARAAGRREPFDAYAADALVRAVTDGAKVATTVVLRADITAVRRGEAHDGEICEIPGVGPVPVRAVREAWGDAFVKLVVTDGVDVRNVVHLGRKATEIQRTALLERDGYRCNGRGCDQSEGLEIDHVLGWTVTRQTAVDDLQLLCRWDHRRKTARQRAVPRDGPDRRSA